MLALSFVAKYQHVETHSTFTDEVLSAVVAKSVFENGLPLLPSETIYYRAPLHHYLLSIPVGLFGIDYLPMRFNSLIFSLIAIYMIYLLGAKSAGRNAGLAAAALLCLNSIFNQYSLAGRMYMTYALMYLLAFYYFYDGFVGRKSSSKKLALLFMAAAILASEAGLLIGPVFFVLLIVYRRMAWVREPVVWVAGLVWAALAALILWYKIPAAYDSFTGNAGLHQGLLLNLNVSLKRLFIDATYSIRNLDAIVPYSTPFFVLMAFWVIAKRQFKAHYALAALLPALLLQSFYSFKVQDRIIVTLVPLYVLACCHFAATLWRWCRNAIGENGSVTGAFAKNAGKVGISVFVFLCFSSGVYYEKRLRQASGVKKYSYLPFYDHYAETDPRQGYLYLNANVRPGDTVVQTTAEYGLFFLKHDVDYYYLRQRAFRVKSNKIRYTSFKKGHEPYYAHPIIDSIPKLEKLIAEAGSPVWVVLGPKTVWALSSELRGYVEKNFKLMFHEKKTKIYRRNPWA